MSLSSKKVEFAFAVRPFSAEPSFTARSLPALSDRLKAPATLPLALPHRAPEKEIPSGQFYKQGNSCGKVQHDRKNWHRRAKSVEENSRGWGSSVKSIPLPYFLHVLPPQKGSPPACPPASPAAGCCSFKLNCSPRY